MIDLRETFSVGPAIAVLDQLVRWLVPASHRSAVVGTAESVLASMRATPVRATSVVFGVAVIANLVFTLVVDEPTQEGGGSSHASSSSGWPPFGTRVSLSWVELVETWVVQLMIAALESPEPPEDR